MGTETQIDISGKIENNITSSIDNAFISTETSNGTIEGKLKMYDAEVPLRITTISNRKVVKL